MSVSKAFFLRLACKVQITKEAGLLIIIIIIASNNQGLRSLGRQRSKVKTRLLRRSVLCRFRATDSQNIRDQITTGRTSKHGWSHCLLCIPFILSGSPNKLLATYMRRMRNNNLEIKIAGSSYRPQLFYYWKYYSQLLPILMLLGRGTMCPFSIYVRLIESQLKGVINLGTSPKWPSLYLSITWKGMFLKPCHDVCTLRSRHVTLPW